MALTPFTYPGTVLEVIDGDTYLVEYQLQQGTDSKTGLFAREYVRLTGVDAWESRKANRAFGPVTDAEVELGRKAKLYAQGLLLSQPVFLTIEGKDSFGRTLGKVSLSGRDVGVMLVEACHALPYDGKNYGAAASGCTNPRAK